MFQYVGLIYDFVSQKYDINNKLINLKLRHTVRVYKLMIELVESLELSNEDKRLALFIALFHDLGRFLEIEMNEKFDNIKIDHAELSNKVLFEYGFIKNFPIKEEDYELVRKAVYYHNKYDIPADLSEREKLFCNLIRDVDKIDILHVLSKEYEKEFNSIPTDKVLESFYNHKMIDLHDIKNSGDAITLYLAFQDQLAFNESKDILYSKHYLEEFINSIKVPNDQYIQDVFAHLRDEALSHRDDYLYSKRLIRKR